MKDTQKNQKKAHFCMNLPEDLFVAFKKKVIEERTTATNVVIKLMKKYVEA